MIIHATLPIPPLGFVPELNPMMHLTETEVMLALCPVGGTVLEIGTHLGVTTGNLARRAARVVTVDVSRPPLKLHGQQSIVECLPVEQIGSAIPEEVKARCEIVLIDPVSPQALISALDEKKTHFDLIVLDGDHSPRAVLADYLATRYWLSDKGVILLHDCWWDVLPYPVEGPMTLLQERGGVILNKTHFGILAEHLDRFTLELKLVGQ